MPTVLHSLGMVLPGQVRTSIVEMLGNARRALFEAVPDTFVGYPPQAFSNESDFRASECSNV